MVRLAGTFSQLAPFKALVVGDLMLDIYTTGSIDRISPEAPVPVLHIKKRHQKAGGAGNVALGLVSLGGNVSIMGRVGHDASGLAVRKALKDAGVDTSYLFDEKGVITPLKNRIIAENQQLLRIDEETKFPPSQQIEDQMLQALEKEIASFSIVTVSDYNKGTLTPRLLQGIIAMSNACGIPVVCDPKGVDFSLYQRAFIVKPNTKEAYFAAGLPSEASLDEVADALFQKTQSPHLLITKSGDGMSLFTRNGPRKDFPVQVREVVDVTGAGDTVLATLSAAIASSLPLDDAVHLANISASIAIEKMGCALVTLSDVARRLLETDVDSKVFHETHLYALQKAREKCVISILEVDTNEGITPKLLQTIRTIAKSPSEELVLYIQDDVPDEDFIHVLSSLNEVDFIILRKESLQHLCQSIRPKKVYFTKKNETAPSWLSALSTGS